MIPVSQRFLDALAGSNQPYVNAGAWYDGRFLVQSLPIVGGSITGTDDGDSIRHTLSLQVADKDGSLIPHHETDPLSHHGQRINIRAGYHIGRGQVEATSVGWFQIQTGKAKLRWTQYHRPTGDTFDVYRGSIIDVTGEDLGRVVKDAKFLAPEQPVRTDSVKAEVIRLLWGLRVPLVGTAWPGVSDSLIHPGSVTYTDDRWSAICDLAKYVNAIPYLDKDGDLIFRPIDMGASVWTVAGGEGGVLVDADLEWSRDRMFNLVVARGESQEPALQIGKFAVEQADAAAWEGPFGHVPAFISSPLIVDGNTADTAAVRELKSHIQRRGFPIGVTCLCNYALQVGDTVTLELPEGSVDGRIQEATWPLTPGPMTMTVNVPRDQIWSIYGSFGRFSVGVGGFV